MSGRPRGTGAVLQPRRGAGPVRARGARAAVGADRHGRQCRGRSNFGAPGRRGSEVLRADLKPSQIKHKLRCGRGFSCGMPSASDRRSAPDFLRPLLQNYSALFTAGCDSMGSTGRALRWRLSAPSRIGRCGAGIGSVGYGRGPSQAWARNRQFVGCVLCREHHRCEWSDRS